MKKLIIYILLLNVFCINKNFAQSIDSLQLALKNANHDTTRCLILDQLSNLSGDDVWPQYNEQLYQLAKKKSVTENTIFLKNIYLEYLSTAVNNKAYLADLQGKPAVAISYYKECLKIEEMLQNKERVAHYSNLIGMNYETIGNISEALLFLNNSLKIHEALKDKKGIATSLNNLGSVYERQGDIPKGLDYYHKSLKLLEQINHKLGIATAYNNIGNVYRNQGDINKALEYYLKCLTLLEQLQNKKALASSLLNIALLYFNKGETEKAFDYQTKSLQINREIDNKPGTASALHQLGHFHDKNGEYLKALECLNNALTLREEIQDKNGTSQSLNAIAVVNIKLARLNEALNIANRGLKLAKELGFPETIRDLAETLKKINTLKNNHKEAFEMYELEIKMRDSINNQETQKAALRKQMQYDYDKKELLLKAEQDKKDIIAQEELRQKEKERNYFIAGFSLVLLLALFILRGYRQKQKDNKLITTQKDLVEEKQKEILDSIHYAKRIQTALMTNENYIDKSLKRLNK